MTESGEWSDQPVISPVVIVVSSAAGSGLFVYTPALAAGDLIASIAGAGSTDTANNPYLIGIADYGTNHAVQLNSGSITLLQFPSPGGGAQGATIGQGTALDGTLVLDSGLSAAGDTPAKLWFFSRNRGGLTVATVSIDGVATQLTALDPATGNSPETWHSLGTLAGYTVTAGRYRLTPEGEVELDIDVLPGGANASTTAFSNTLPAAYTPPSSRPFPVAYNRNVTAGDTWPHILVSSTGTVSVVVQANIGTQISCNQRYPLS